MIAIGVLAVVGDKRPTGDGIYRVPNRELRVTEQGRRVLDAAARREDGVRLPGTGRSDADHQANSAVGYTPGDGPSEDRI